MTQEQQRLFELTVPAPRHRRRLSGLGTIMNAVAVTPELRAVAQKALDVAPAGVGNRGDGEAVEAAFADLLTDRQQTAISDAVRHNLGADPIPGVGVLSSLRWEWLGHLSNRAPADFKVTIEGTDGAATVWVNLKLATSPETKNHASHSCSTATLCRVMRGDADILTADPIDVDAWAVGLHRGTERIRATADYSILTISARSRRLLSVDATGLLSSIITIRQIHRARHDGGVGAADRLVWARQKANPSIIIARPASGIIPDEFDINRAAAWALTPPAMSAAQIELHNIAARAA